MRACRAPNMRASFGPERVTPIVRVKAGENSPPSARPSSTSCSTRGSATSRCWWTSRRKRGSSRNPVPGTHTARSESDRAARTEAVLKDHPDLAVEVEAKVKEHLGVKPVVVAADEEASAPRSECRPSPHSPPIRASRAIGWWRWIGAICFPPTGGARAAEPPARGGARARGTGPPARACRCGGRRASALRALARRAHARLDLQRRLVKKRTRRPPWRRRSSGSPSAACSMTTASPSSTPRCARRGARGPARLLRDLQAQGVERRTAEHAVRRALEEEGIDPALEARAVAAKRARQLAVCRFRCANAACSRFWCAGAMPGCS